MNGNLIETGPTEKKCLFHLRIKLLVIILMVVLVKLFEVKKMHEIFLDELKKIKRRIYGDGCLRK